MGGPPMLVAARRAPLRPPTRSERGASGFVQLRQNNLLGFGGRLLARLRGGGLQDHVALDTQHDRFLGSNLVLAGGVCYRAERPRFYDKGKEIGKLDVRRYGGLLNIGLNVKRVGLISLGGRFEDVSLKHDSKLGVDARSDRLRMALIRVIADNLNDGVLPTAGWFSSVTCESALGGLGFVGGGLGVGGLIGGGFGWHSSG